MRIPQAALNATALIRPLVGLDLLGNQTKVGCRVELSRSVKTDAQDGAQTPLIAGRAFFPPHVLLPPGSEITLDGRVYRTNYENRPQSVFGAVYTEVRFE